MRFRSLVRLRWLAAGLGWAIVLGGSRLALAAEHAARRPPVTAVRSSSPIAEEPPRHPTTRPDLARRPASGRSGASGGGWLVMVGASLAVAALGGLTLALRRWRPAPEVGGLRVVGRTSLSPRHSVFLLQVGERVLIVGTGSQGPPSLLGEMPATAPGAEQPRGGAH